STRLSGSFLASNTGLSVPRTRIPTEENEDHDTDLRLWEDSVYRSEVREASKEGSHESCRRTQEERHSHPSKAGNPDPEHSSLSWSGRPHRPRKVNIFPEENDV